MKNIKKFESFLGIKKALSFDKKYQDVQQVNNAIQNIVTNFCKKNKGFSERSNEFSRGVTISNGSIFVNYVVSNFNYSSQKVDIVVTIKKYSSGVQKFELSINSDDLNSIISSDIKKRIV